MDGCGRPHNARGLCGLHYRHAQNAGLIGTPCSIEGCKKPRVGDSLCSTHYAARHRDRNREVINARQREYLKRWRVESEDTEKRKAREKRYRRNNLEKFADKERSRRGRKRGNGGSYTRKDWIDLLNRFCGRCAYCGTRGDMTADHVVPLAKGGSNYIGNILPACFSCNSSKQDRLLFEWRNRHERENFRVTKASRTVS